MSENRDDDRDLEAFLVRNSALQRRWREAMGDEPPAALDAAVRAAARRAAGSRPHDPHTRFAVRWRVPLSIAAVVVVSVTVALMVADRREHMPGAQWDQLSPPPAPQPAERLEADNPAAQSARGPVPSTPDAAPAGSPSAAQKTQGTEVRGGGVSGSNEAAGLRAAESTADGPMQAVPASPEPQRAHRATGGEVEKDEQRSSVAEMRERAAPQRSRAAPAAGPPPAGRDHSMAPGPAAESPAPAQQGAAETQARSAPRALTKRVPVDERPVERMAPRTDAAAESEEIAVGTEGEAQRWIDRIRELRRAGRLQEAEESLREFRQRFPAHQLPPDLRPLP